MKKNILLIGAGKWGKNYIHTAKNIENINLLVATRHNWQNLVSSKDIQGVIIATPPESHIEIAEFCLDKQIPVMIEKPLALSEKDCLVLQKYVYDTIILVNYIQLFTSAYSFAKKNMDIPSFITTKNYNSGPIRTYSPLWDYGVHDLSIILDLLEEFPTEYKVKKISTNNGEIYNLNMKFSSCYTQSMFGNGALEKVQRFDIDTNGVTISYNDINKPVNYTPPLLTAVKTFIKLIDGQQDYRVGLDLSLKISRILDSLGTQ